MSAPVPLVRRAAAEAVGTAALVAVVVGSGIQAGEPTRDVGLQLPANSLATVFGPGVLIALLGPAPGPGRLHLRAPGARNRGRGRRPARRAASRQSRPTC
ncbi:hypothetical protein GCM10018783_07450 [Streptomyces griseosporeus]|nr:hypothetical protein GCM10018783_07450 [Streptomyces griseosporeus]